MIRKLKIGTLNFLLHRNWNRLRKYALQAWEDSIFEWLIIKVDQFYGWLYWEPKNVLGFKKQFHEEYILLHPWDAAYITQNFHALVIPLSLPEMPFLPRLRSLNPTLQGLVPLPQPWVMPSFSELLDHSLYNHLLMIFYFFQVNVDDLLNWYKASFY